MTPRRRRRITVALLASMVLHLLMLAAYVRMADWYRRQDLRPTRYLPDLLLLAPQLFRQQPIGTIPERLMEQVEGPAEPGQAEALPWIDASPQALAPGEPPPADDRLAAAGQRPAQFIAQPDLGDFSLNEQDIEAVGQLREQYDAYARYWTPDLDPTDPESQNRAKAAAIVARAFEAMGGLEELLKIRQMRTVVWLVAWQTQVGEGRTAYLDTVEPFAYPIATWHMHGLDKFERDVFRVEFDLFSGTFPSYVAKNPAPARQRYYNLFDARWMLSAPPTTQMRRRKAEAARWHIVDRFLGEGIRLSYEGRGKLGFPARRVERVAVDDRKFGRLFEAYFDVESGRLRALREVLDADEAKWFRQKYNRKSPEWVTQYMDYRPVEAVLLPHHWRRTVFSPDGRPMLLDVHFNIAINDAHPDTVAPDLN